MRKLLIILICAFLACPASFAALNSTVQFTVTPGGSDSNPGGFDPYATFDTDLACTVATGNSPVCTSATYTFVSGDVGAWLFVQSGTNWKPGWSQIASVSGGAATVNAAVGLVPIYTATVDVGAGFLGLYTTAGIATTASPTAGVWGIDYSQQNSPQISYSDLTVQSTTTKFQSSENPVKPNVVGNLITVSAGSGCTTGTFEVLSYSGTTATVDRSLGTSTDVCTAVLGGANAGVCDSLSGTSCTSGAFANATPNNSWIMVHVKSGTYTQSNTIYNKNSGGTCITPFVFGYGSVHGDWGTQPTIQGSFGTSGLLQIAYCSSGYYDYFANLNLKNTATSIGNGYGVFYEYNVSGGDLYLIGDTIDSSAASSVTGSQCAMILYNLDTGEGQISTVIYGSTFKLSSSVYGVCDLGGNSNISVFDWNLFSNGIAAIYDFAQANGQRWMIRHNCFVSNTRAVYSAAGGLSFLDLERNGFYGTTDENVRLTSGSPGWIAFVNNLFWGGTYGLYINAAAGAPASSFSNGNAFGNIGTANYNNFIPTTMWGHQPDVSIASNPFVSAPGGNCALTTGAQSLIGGAGWPGIAPFGTGYAAIGPLQPQAASSSSAPHAYVQ